MLNKTPTALFLLIGSLGATEALAASCQVSTRSLSQKIPAVVTQSCYTYKGIEADAIEWSCSQDDDVGMFDYDKKLVDNCPSDYFASCESTLTQSALSNHEAISDLKTGTPMVIPDGAKMLTYFYSVDEQEQARQDCTALGGNWRRNQDH
jgi:hypothetical protein